MLVLFIRRWPYQPARIDDNELPGAAYFPLYEDGWLPRIVWDLTPPVIRLGQDDPEWIPPLLIGLEDGHRPWWPRWEPWAVRQLPGLDDSEWVPGVFWLDENYWPALSIWPAWASRALPGLEDAEWIPSIFGLDEDYWSWWMPWKEWSSTALPGLSDVEWVLGVFGLDDQPWVSWAPWPVLPPRIALGIDDADVAIFANFYLDEDAWAVHQAATSRNAAYAVAPWYVLQMIGQEATTPGAPPAPFFPIRIDRKAGTLVVLTRASGTITSEEG